jgi:hypothetical protein
MLGLGDFCDGFWGRLLSMSRKQPVLRGGMHDRRRGRVKIVLKLLSRALIFCRLWRVLCEDAKIQGSNPLFFSHSRTLASKSHDDSMREL